MDVEAAFLYETAFLYGDIDEEICMKSPVGMEADQKTATN